MLKRVDMCRRMYNVDVVEIKAWPWEKAPLLLLGSNRGTKVSSEAQMGDEG